MEKEEVGDKMSQGSLREGKAGFGRVLEKKID